MTEQSTADAINNAIDDLTDVLTTLDPSTEKLVNLVDGLFAIARSIDGLTSSIHRLGTADAATPMGAIEALSKGIEDGCDTIALAVRSLDTISVSVTEDNDGL